MVNYLVSEQSLSYLHAKSNCFIGLNHSISTNKLMNKRPIVFLFRAQFGDSRLQEIASLGTVLHGVAPTDWSWNKDVHAYHGGDIGPDLIQFAPQDSSFPPQVWADIAHASVSCRGAFVVLGEGENLAACIQSVRSVSSSLYQRIDGSWCFRFFSLGRQDRLHPTERTEKVEKFAEVIDVLHHRPVDLERPAHELWLLEDYRRKYKVSESPQDAKYFWLLHRIKGSHEDNSGIDKVSQLALTKRAFINTTTMSPARGLLLAHLALADSGMTVVDPFCGSGGLLLPAAILGAKVIGSDIDTVVLSNDRRRLKMPRSNGRPNRGVEAVSIYDNFYELDLAMPLLLPGLDAFDAATPEQILRANGGRLCDAILTDLPYGIRESKPFANIENVEKLLQLAEGILKTAGRLVFLCVVEGEMSNLHWLAQEQNQQYRELGVVYGFHLLSLGVERFNARLFRLNVVFVRKSIVEA